MDSLQLGEQPTTNEINKYGLEWRVKYIAALEEKLLYLNIAIPIMGLHYGIEQAQLPVDQFSNKTIQFGSNIAIKDNIALRNYAIEALELEHKIYHEKIILRDWKLRAERNEEKTGIELKEATENIERILELCRQKESSNEHIKQLIKRYNTINKHDSDQLIIIYKSMKVALEKTGEKL